MQILLHKVAPTTEKRRRPGQRPGTASLLMMDDVIKFSSLQEVSLTVHQSTLVSALKGANAEIRPGCGYALPRPLRPRAEALNSFKLGMA